MISTELFIMLLFDGDFLLLYQSFALTLSTMLSRCLCVIPTQRMLSCLLICTLLLSTGPCVCAILGPSAPTTEPCVVLPCIWVQHAVDLHTGTRELLCHRAVTGGEVSVTVVV